MRRHGPALLCPLSQSGLPGAASERLGYEVTGCGGRCPDCEAIMADVHRVAAAPDRLPTVPEYDDQGRFAARTTARRLGDGSWLSVLEDLGYDITERHLSVADAALRRDLKRVADDLGRLLTSPKYDDHSRYAPITIARRFGGAPVRMALSTLGLDSDSTTDSQSDEDVRDALRAAVVGDID